MEQAQAPQSALEKNGFGLNVEAGGFFPSPLTDLPQAFTVTETHVVWRNGEHMVGCKVSDVLSFDYEYGDQPITNVQDGSGSGAGDDDVVGVFAEEDVSNPFEGFGSIGAPSSVAVEDDNTDNAGA